MHVLGLGLRVGLPDAVEGQVECMCGRVCGNRRYHPLQLLAVYVLGITLGLGSGTQVSTRVSVRLMVECMC